MQTWKESLVESTLNVGSGFVVSYLIWVYIVGPLFGIHMAAAQNLAVITIFTVGSLLRNFIWRRLFNWYDAKREQKQ